VRELHLILIQTTRRLERQQRQFSSFYGTHLFYKGATTSIHHQNVRRRPGFHLSSLFGASGISSSGVHIRITQIRIRIVHVLSNRTTIGWDSKQSLPVIVSFLPEQTVGNLSSRIQQNRKTERKVLVKYFLDGTSFPKALQTSLHSSVSIA
jgi:hypothetical protein